MSAPTGGTLDGHFAHTLFKDLAWGPTLRYMEYWSPYLLVKILAPLRLRADDSDLALVASTVSDHGKGESELGSSKTTVLDSEAKHAPSVIPPDCHAPGMNFTATPVTVNSSKFGNIARNCPPEPLIPKLPVKLPW